MSDDALSLAPELHVARRARPMAGEEAEARSRGRVPPHDLDAEAAVLSSILLDETGLARVSYFLKPEYFYSPANGAIYEACLELSEEGQPIDVIQAASKLRTNGRLQQVGGPGYLGFLADATPAVSHIVAHAHTVYEKWRMRQAIAECQVTAATGYTETQDVSAFLAGHLDRVFALSRGLSTRTDPTRAGVILDAELANLSNRGSLFGIATGFHRLDVKLAGLHDGDLSIYAGRPGMGKSAIAMDIAINVADSPLPQNLPEGTPDEQLPPEHAALFCSLEMPREQLAIRAACSVGFVDLARVRSGGLDEGDWARLAQAAAWLKTKPLWLDDTPAISVLDLRAKIRLVQAQWDRPAAPGQRARRVGVVIVDYLQLMAGRGREHSREETTANISKDLKALAKELRVPIIALAQLNRAVELRAIKDRRPQMSDLRESGQLEQDADNIVFLFRPEYYQPGLEGMQDVAEAIVAKQRNGSTGRVLLRFRAKFTRFEEWDDADYKRLRALYDQMKL